MNRVRRTLTRAAADLRAVGRPFALVGGFAVSVRTEPRMTRDVDFVVAVAGDADAERLVADLVGRGYAIITAIEQVAVARLATVRLASPGGSVVDLLFASSGVEAEIVAGSQELTVVRGVRLAVPRVGDLIALKVLSRDDAARPQDRVDLAALLAVAAPEELTRARHTLELISTRGFDRGKDLVAELDRAGAELSPSPK